MNGLESISNAMHQMRMDAYLIKWSNEYPNDLIIEFCHKYAVIDYRSIAPTKPCRTCTLSQLSHLKALYSRHRLDHRHRQPQTQRTYAGSRPAKVPRASRKPIPPRPILQQDASPKPF
jgi:hypothetical protein